MEKITIGLLLPISSILPVSKDFEKGLKDAGMDCAVEFEYVREFIGQGGRKQTEEACLRFFNYHSVDIVTGIVANIVALPVASRFAVNRTPFIINNLGEHFPNPAELNDYVFINSCNLWQQAWALGNWGVKQFGKKGMYISAVYEAGYSFSDMFYKGMLTADPASCWSFSVPPMPPNGELTDMSIIFPFLEKYKPDFVFAGFCGEECSLFIEQFIERGWHKRTALLGLPFLLNLVKPLPDDLCIYTTCPFINDTEIMAENSYYMLGYQTGRMIGEAMKDERKSALSARLLDIREMYNLNIKKLLSNEYSSSIKLKRHKVNKGEVYGSSEVIENVPAPSFYAKEIKDIFSKINTSWQNPYLCI